MRTSGHKLMMAGATVFMLLLVAFIVLQTVTEDRRRAAVDRTRNLETFQRYGVAHSGKGQVGSERAIQGENGPPASQFSDEQKKATFVHIIERIKALSKDAKWLEAEDWLSAAAEEWTEKGWARLKDLMASWHSVVLEIRHVAEMGGPAYEVDLTDKGRDKLLSYHGDDFIKLPRLVYADAFVCAHEKNYTEAAEDILALVRLAGVARDEPTVGSQRRAMVLDEWSVQAVAKTLPPKGSSPELTRKLIEYVGQVDVRGHLADALYQEGVFVLDAFDNLREGGSSDDFFPGGLFAFVYGSVLARPWLSMDEETYANMTQRLAETAWLPYYEALPRAHEIEQDVADLPYTRMMSEPLLRHQLPDYLLVLESAARSEAVLDLIRIGLSVEQYRATAGSLPETLDAIAPSLGGTAPVDPFTGQPYHYQPSGTSFLLYSVGPNLKDDGGAPGNETGDLVWRGNNHKE